MKLYKGDCLIESDKIEDSSIDLILTDLPYGTVKNIQLKGWDNNTTKWDNVIDAKRIYNIANRILRKNGKMVLFAQDPFSTYLKNEAIPNIPHNYNLIWEKDHFASPLLAKKAPVNYYEDILVFSKTSAGNNKVKDYLVKEKEKAYTNSWTDQTLRKLCNLSLKGGGQLGHYWGKAQWSMPTLKTYTLLQETGFFQKPHGELKTLYEKLYAPVFNLPEGQKHKSNILKYKKDYDGFHPTQKPVALLEDLIKTYTNEGHTVVDFTMGSGSTGVAAKNTNRKFIGIEMDDEYYDIACKRVGL